MDTRIYQITLSDGTILDDLRLNGDTFISQKQIDPAVFTDNCATVTISDGEAEETYHFMQYVPTAQPVPGEFWFSFVEISEQELAMMRMQANIDYMSMMTGVEL